MGFVEISATIYHHRQHNLMRLYLTAAEARRDVPLQKIISLEMVQASMIEPCTRNMYL